MVARPTEYEEQCMFFDYVRIKANNDHRYKMVSSSQNGASLRGGAAAYYGLLKAGFSNGFPDISCLVPVGKHHGLFIEMKRKPNTPSKDQRDWLDRLNNLGYLAVVAWSAEDAIRILDAYLFTRGQPHDAQEP